MAEPVNDSTQQYIGQGVAFPARVSVQGGLQLSASLTSIEESIYLILRTNIGERLYRPDFGSRLAELVFAPLNTQTLLLIRLYVEEALKLWEPRITVHEIRTDPDPTRGRVDIAIHYSPKNIIERRSMVYPFYLVPPTEEQELG